MNLKAFLVDALGAALDLGIATPDDVLRHVTPDVLAQHLPRPLWARLLTACLGASRVDAQLVIETIGVPNLCEHVPPAILWACLADVGARALGKAPQATVAPAPRLVEKPRAAVPLTRPPPEVVVSAAAKAPAPAVAVGPSIPAPVNEPLADLITELEQDDRPAVARGRSPTQQRFRQSNTGIGRLGANQSRRPQAAVPTPAPVAASRPNRRAATEVSEPAMEDSEFRAPIAVDDSQLVDWQASEETVTHANDDFGDVGRKR